MAAAVRHSLRERLEKEAPMAAALLESCEHLQQFTQQQGPEYRPVYDQAVALLVAEVIPSVHNPDGPERLIAEIDGRIEDYLTTDEARRTYNVYQRVSMLADPLYAEDIDALGLVEAFANAEAEALDLLADDIIREAEAIANAPHREEYREMKTETETETTATAAATAQCPDCGHSQQYLYEEGNRLEMMRTAAVALETLPHAPECPRHTHRPQARGNAQELQANLF